MFGPNYEAFTSSMIDVSLIASFKRFSLPSIMAGVLGLAILGITLLVMARNPISETVLLPGMLIAASLLLAPYAAANSVLSLVAIGVIPLFQSRVLLGSILILMVNVPFLFSREMLFSIQASYWTVLIVLIWAILHCIVWTHRPARGMHQEPDLLLEA
jgi:hypothetical protein